MAKGFDPPHQATVVQDVDIDSAGPLLKPPRVFEMVCTQLWFSPYHQLLPLLVRTSAVATAVDRGVHKPCTLRLTPAFFNPLPTGLGG